MIKPITKSKQIRENFSDNWASLEGSLKDETMSPDPFEIEKDTQDNITKITLTEDLELQRPNHLIVNTEFIILENVTLTLPGALYIGFLGNDPKEDKKGTLNNYGTILFDEVILPDDEDSLVLGVGYSKGNKDKPGAEVFVKGTLNNYGTITGNGFNCLTPIIASVLASPEDTTVYSVEGTFNNYGTIQDIVRMTLAYHKGPSSNSGKADGTFNNYGTINQCFDGVLDFDGFGRKDDRDNDNSKLVVKGTFNNCGKDIPIVIGDARPVTFKKGKTYTVTNNSTLLTTDNNGSESSLKYWLIGISVLILIIVLIVLADK